MPELTHLDLFSGVGGFSMAAHWLGIRTTQFVEIDPTAQAALKRKFPEVPIHDDIATFIATGKHYSIITAGFPCQDISLSNPSATGLEGKRSGLFYETIRIIRECRPEYVVLENVTGLLRARDGRDMGAVLWELSRCGYDAEWCVIYASELGAYQSRGRVFILAYPNSSSQRGDGGRFQEKLSRQKTPIRENSAIQIPGFLRPDIWEMHARNGRNANGSTSRLNR